MRRIGISVAVLLLFAAVGQVNGSIVTFDDKAAFLSATSASLAADMDTAPYGNNGMSMVVGDLTFTSQTREFWVMEWTALLSGCDLAISDKESMDVAVTLGGEYHSFGFEFVEPTVGAGAPPVDSTFTVTLLSGATFVDEFTFNAPDDVATFVGVWSTPHQAFNTVEIRETVGSNDNEFFGEFYLGTKAIPEPASVIVWSLLGGLGITIGWWRRRRKAA